MRGHLRHRGHAHSPFIAILPGTRQFVIWEGARGCRVWVHHPYGRVERLGPAAGFQGFSDLDEALDAVAREVLRREPDLAVCRELRRRLAGSGPRWELSEEEVRVAAGRLARVA